MTSAFPLPALLSQLLVAWTLEFDNEFERRMIEAGNSGAILSLTLWANLMRFVGPNGIAVRELAAKALATETRIKHRLGCLERWGCIVLQSDGPETHRDGWGSGRGIRAGWIVRLTARGQTASDIWPGIFDTIGRRWEMRFGIDQIAALRRALLGVAGRLDLELPDALPDGFDSPREYPPRVTPQGVEPELPLSALFSRVLLMFRIEFDRDSLVPLDLCENTLRVLGDQPIRESDIPRLTGASPETSGIGWQIKPYVEIGPDPAAKRGKVVRLSARGLAARQACERLIAEIERRWEQKYGAEEIRRLREALVELLEMDGENGLLLAEGFIPARGTVRSGALEPALGRRDVGSAARKRVREMVAQTEAFIRDPLGTLPHYPLWDMNRGFGP